MMRKFILLMAVVWWSAVQLLGAEYHGQVTFGGLPLPGAIVTATRADKKVVAITDAQGNYSFPDLADGTWTIEVQMTAFETARQDVTVGPNTAESKWELKAISADRITAAPVIRQSQPEPTVTSGAPPPTPGGAKPATQSAANTPPAPPARPGGEPASEMNDRAADGLLINGSTNNGAASPFAQFPAFGNNRFGRRSLYNGGLGVILDNSALDARPFSLTGQDTPQPSYSRITGLATLGGPLRIPHLLRNGPNFFVAYQWTRNRNASTLPALMPTAAERSGNLSGLPGSILDPVTNTPFAGNVIPASRISPQAQALLGLYPLPNFDLTARYNYQIPTVSATHTDALQSRLNKSFGRRDQVYGDFAFQSSRADTPNVFDFLDTTDTFGLNVGVNWSHRFGQRMFMNLGYRFNRFSTRTTPFFAGRENVSGAAGIAGNDQTPVNWGPPALTFTSGITGVSDAQSAWNRNQTGSVSDAMQWSHNRHNISFGGDFRRQEFNYLSQQDARGAFTFTGDATGSDFADF
ncbi:MAG TPA: carboxypeptidase-like regulatory domain-containing protein, partial [Bryobacteraceae bacterium]|nr:carboxypeptidase-like regulatory domain-containing protein [Bryobacteraceae bacterium]